MPHDPQPSEIRLVEFEPNVGSEIDKVRPAVVVSVPGFTNLPLRIIVPIRGTLHTRNFAWFIPIHQSTLNRLSKDSEIDASQVHAFDVGRFIKKIGSISSTQLEEVRNAIALCIGL
jgi:mRNA interferase MazF